MKKRLLCAVLAVSMLTALPAFAAGSATDTATYTVKRGDLYGKIAVDNYGSYGAWRLIYERNDRKKLFEGTELILPDTLGRYTRLPRPVAGEGETLYTVKAGDTLSGIAKTVYGDVSRYMDIFTRNADRLKNANTIYEGQTIVLPTLTDKPRGVARLCAPVGENQYLLLYDISGENIDYFYLYDGEKGTYRQVVSGEGLWDGADAHLSVTDTEILYESGSGRLYSLMSQGVWVLSEQTKSTDHPYVISPKGDRYVIRENGEVKLYDMRDTLLAQSGVTDATAMEWSADGSRVAIVTNARSAVTVWDTERGERMTYSATPDNGCPENWVEISRAYVVDGTSALLVDYLCETGTTFVLWDMATEQCVDQITVVGDATILDFADGRVLYAASPDGEARTLRCYQWDTKETTVLDSFGGFYTAGCFGTRDDQVLTFRYDAKTKIGTLTMLSK